MSIRRKRRGVSFGTVFMLILCAATIFAGFIIFTRISGDVGELTIDPKLLTQPLTVLTRNVAGVTTPTAMPSALPTAPTTEPTPAPPAATPSPTPAKNITFSLTAAGQVSIGTELRANASLPDGAFDFYDMLSPVAPYLGGTNLTIATMRTGLSSTQPYSSYRAPAALADGLKAAGFSLLNFATDRVMDYGVAGVLDTRTVMEGTGIRFAGIYRTQEERARPSMLEVDGVKIGILSYTSGMSNAGREAAKGEDIALSTRHLTAQAAAGEITALRVSGADIIIVLAHWGNRSDQKPSKETKAEADALIAAGADVILGTGPTSIHEMERRILNDVYGEKREAFIAYSLGNFLIDDSRDTANITGLILHMDITWNDQAQRISFEEPWYMPTWIMRFWDGGLNRYRVVPAGTSTLPQGMTESIYINMKKAYQNTVNLLGTEVATPRGE